MKKEELLNELYKLNRFEVGVGVLDFMSRTAVKLNHVLALVEQLDEPEVLSKEWIDKHITDGHNVNLGDKVVYADELDGVLVPKQELPVIPQFVADWWGRDGDSVTMYGGESIDKKRKIHLISNFNDRGLDDHLSKVEDWIDENESSFLDLVNGKVYEIEKEPLYYAKIKGHELIDTEPILDDDTGKDVSEWNRNIYFIQQLNKKIVIDMKDSGLRGAKHFMTIKEWAELGINEANAEFEPVEEEEE